MKKEEARFPGGGDKKIEALSDLASLYEVINDAAVAYRGVIPADRYHEPYMPMDELQREIAAGVNFTCARRDGRVVAVMGLQHVKDVALIRHAYTLTAYQGRGIGAELLGALRRKTDRPVLVGTWKAATWAVRFYEGRGFRLVSDAEKVRLLKRYWTVSDRQIEESVVLAA